MSDGREEMKRLLKEHLDTLFGYARFLTGDREKARDLVQDTIIKALDNSHLYQNKQSFRSWIFTVMRNLYINQMRRNGVMFEVSESDLSSEDSAPFEFEDTFSSPEYSVDPILKEHLETALQRLSPEYREVVYFIDVEEFSYEETGKMLGIPTGTVMSRIHRARRALKSLLTKEAGEILEFKVRRHA